jgi:hypothetical protein
MKNFYLLNFDEYPTEKIRLNGTIEEEYKDDDLTKVIIEKNIYSNVVRYLILPFHRFSKNYHTIILQNETITIKELTDIIYDFYNKKELTLFDLKNLDDDDVYDYITDIIISKKENPKLVVNPIDIMGDKTFLEYITIYEDQSGDIQYMLHLGS